MTAAARPEETPITRATSAAEDECPKNWPRHLDLLGVERQNTQALEKEQEGCHAQDCSDPEPHLYLCQRIDRQPILQLTDQGTAHHQDVAIWQQVPS